MKAEIKRLHSIIRERDDEIAQLRFTIKWLGELEASAREKEDHGFWKEGDQWERYVVNK